MTKQATILFGTVLLCALSKISANESNVKQIAPEEDSSPKLDNNQPYGTAQNIQSENEGASGQREKRFYNYVDYNLDYNMNSEFSSFNKRRDDPLEIILRKLQDITNTFNQRTYLPPPTIPRPTYIPFLYIPKILCPCPNNQPVTPSKQPLPDIQPPPINPDKNSTTNTTQATDANIPLFNDRFPDIEDSREIWSTSDTSADYEIGDETDGSRPISLNPIKPNRPSSVPSPPVEHGSVQAGLQPAPEQPDADMGPPPNVATEDNPAIPPQNNVGISSCESAAVTCCHKPQVTYECFRSNNCNNPTELGSPCDPQVMLKIINKLQYYYGSKNTSDSS